MGNQLVKVNGKQEFMGKEIPVIEGGFGEDCRVMCDKSIADIHSMETFHIRENIKKNIGRFKSGTDFIDLKVIGDADNNSEMLQSMGYTKMQISKAQNIYLLSERGYSKLIKIMDTDLAWEIHDELIDNYFAMRKQIKQELASYLIDDPIARAYAWIEEQKQKTLLLEEVKTLTPLAELARKRLDKTGLVSLTDITETFSLRKGQFTTWAKTNGYLHKTLTEVNEKGKEYFRVYSYDNEHKSIGINENGIKLIDDNLPEIQNSPCRFVKESKKDGETNEL